METAFAHCRPGGAALFAPDHLRENFRTGTDYGGHDGDGRAARFLEWTWDPDPLDTTYTVDYAYLLREADGSVRVEHDRHVEGLFPGHLAAAPGGDRLHGPGGPGGALGAGAGQLRAAGRHQAAQVGTPVSLLGRRRVIQDYLAGALWVLPTLEVVVFLLARAALSNVEVAERSPCEAGLPGHRRRRPLAADRGVVDHDHGHRPGVRPDHRRPADRLRPVLAAAAAQLHARPGHPAGAEHLRGPSYSTAGLHTVGVQGAGQEAFVPRLAVSGSLALAVASVGVLIYFIHHLARSIQIDSIMKQVEREALSVIAEVYPRQPSYREPEELCLAAAGGGRPAVGPLRLCPGRPPRAAGPGGRGPRPDDRPGQAGRRPRVAGIRQPGPGAGRLGEPPDGAHAGGVAEGVEVGFEWTMGPGLTLRHPPVIDSDNKADLSPAINDPIQRTGRPTPLGRCCCALARLRLGDWMIRDGDGELRVAVPAPSSPTTCGLGTAQPRRIAATRGITRAQTACPRPAGTALPPRPTPHACVPHIGLASAPPPPALGWSRQVACVAHRAEA